MYYTCKRDKAFKYMFLDKDGISILKKLLEFILKENIDKIKLLPTEVTGNNLKTKGKRLDALLEIRNRIIGLEMNSSDKNGYRVKNMSYMCHTYSSIIEEGKTYNEDIELLQINFTYNLKDTKAIREYYIEDKEGKKFVNNFKIIEINMDYFMKMWYSKNEKEIEKNKYLIMLDLQEEELKELSKDKVVREYMERLNKLNKSPRFTRLMSEEEERKKTENTMIENAREDGSTQKSIEIAKKSLEQNLDINTISIITGLSIKEIEELK